MSEVLTQTVDQPVSDVADSKVDSSVDSSAESRLSAVPHTRTRARPRQGAAGSPRPGIVGRLSTIAPLVAWLKVAWKRLATSSPYAGAPPSLKELVEYTRRGGWMPGDQAVWLEFLGKAYGYLIAIPVIAALYAVSWWIAKPTRVMTLALLYALTRWGA